MSNISAFLKHNRPQLAVVYCDFHLGHIWHKSGAVSNHFCISKTQQSTVGHCLFLYSFRASVTQQCVSVKTFLHV